MTASPTTAPPGRRYTRGAPLPPETEFYRGENGGLFAFDPDKVPDSVRKTCTKVSRREIEQR
jgi:hypothetical protein